MKILEGKTVKLRDNENNVILPRTLARNVHMADGETIDEVIQALVERIAELEEAVEALKGGNLPEQPDTPVDPKPEEPEVEVKVEEVVVEGVEEFEFSPEVFEYELQPQEGVEEVSLYVQLSEEVEVKQITVNDVAVEPVLPLEVQLGEEDTVVKVTVDQMEEEPSPASETEKVYTFVFKAIVVPEEPEVPVDPEPVVSHVEDLRIVQYYGAGGKTDGMLTCDFIELYNNGEHDVLLQYATLNYTKMGKTAESQNQWQLIQLPEVVLPSHHSFLVQGKVNRYPVKDSEIPMVVTDCDFACEVEFDNGAIKLVLSQAKEAYPAGQVDPFEIDDTIIDHIYACAEDKGSRMDVAPMIEDLSKNNGALQVTEGVWDIADYKTSHDEPQHANLLPKNMAAGEHYPFAVIGPVAEETHVTVYTDDLNAVETVSYKILNVPADAVVEDMEINGDTNENITFDFETSSIVARTSSILANILYVQEGDTEGKVELKAVFAGYLRVKVYLTVVHGANPDAPVIPDQPDTPVDPEPALAPIMYGYFPLEVGTEFNITSYDKITLEAVRKGVMREAQERVEGKINIAGEGLLPEGAYIVFAIRADLEITPVRDNGFGGHVPFYEEVCGANGVVVDFDGVQYKLFGELALVEGEWFAYMD